MSESDNERRLMRLKRRSIFADKTDDDMLCAIEDSVDFYLDYTNQRIDPGEEVDGLICELATLRINSYGVENIKVAKEGEVEREWYESIPPMLVSRLNHDRRIPGLQ